MRSSAAALIFQVLLCHPVWTQTTMPSGADLQAGRHGLRPETPTSVPQAATVDGERLFGYAGIETEEDLREVSHFSNVIMLDPTSPEFERMVLLARARGMRIGIAWDQVLFNTTSTPYRLRPDHRQRFEQTVASDPRLFRDLAFHQPLDEPYWNGAGEADVDLALALMNEAFPGVPTLIVMAAPTLDVRAEPVPTDWVAFDFYFVRDPVTDPTYQFYWNRMRSQNPDKPIVVVADGFFSPNHASAGLSRNDMSAVLFAYRDLYESEPAAVLLGVFRWTDDGLLEGTRNLPDAVIRDHVAVGSSITGRCGIPAGEDPLAGETVLWFHQCRFYARIEIDDPRTTVVEAVGSSMSDDTGSFWFFNDSNLELLVKVLDGTAFNGYYWVFMSDTTDVNYRLELRDLQTGNVWTHLNEGGAVSVRRDTLAFPP